MTDRGQVALQAAGIVVARVNPRQARDSAKSMGVLAKTDWRSARPIHSRMRKLLTILNAMLRDQSAWDAKSIFRPHERLDLEHSC